MLNLHCSLSHLNRNFIYSVIASLLAMTTVSCQMIPELSRQTPQLTPSSSAHTQDFSDEQVDSYAQAVLQIESYRQQAYQEIEKILASSPPEIVCNQPDTIDKLQGKVQEVAVKYCIDSKKVAENSGLDYEQFNLITLRIQSDKDLKRRVHNSIIRIQRQKK